jgi:hypothetical protein
MYKYIFFKQSCLKNKKVNIKMNFYYVHLTTIPSRFKYLSMVIDSLYKQTVNIEKIVITIQEKYKRFPNHFIKEQDIQKLKDKYDDKLVIQKIDEDYGPNIKILGALKYFETIENKNNSYMLICDDDLQYDKNLILSYQKSLEKDKNIIYTHFNRERMFNNEIIHELQGADTFLLIPKFFELTSYCKYKEYLEVTISECDESFYVDDLVIQFYIILYCKLKIFPCTEIKRYAISFSIDSLHENRKVKYRNNQTYIYFNKKLKEL